MKLFLGAFAFLAVGMLFTACNPDTTVTIVLNQDSVTADPGDIVTFAVTLTPDAANKGELGDFSVSDSANFSMDSTFSGSNSASFNVKYTVPEDAANTTITLTFTAIDGKSGYSTTESARIIVGSGLPEIVETKDVKATYVSTTLENNMMYVLGADGVTTANGSSTDGDLAFVWQNTYGYSICSPDAQWIHDLFAANGQNYTTSDKKNTKIMKYNGNWDDLNQETINALQITSETVSGGGNGVQNLNEGDIVVYETADGRKGALKVNTNTKVTKYMTADLKYQKTPASSGK